MFSLNLMQVCVTILLQLSQKNKLAFIILECMYNCSHFLWHGCHIMTKCVRPIGMYDNKSIFECERWEKFILPFKVSEIM